MLTLYLVTFRHPLLGVPLDGLSPFIHSSLYLIFLFLFFSLTVSVTASLRARFEGPRIFEN